MLQYLFRTFFSKLLYFHSVYLKSLSILEPIDIHACISKWHHTAFHMGLLTFSHYRCSSKWSHKHRLVKRLLLVRDLFVGSPGSFKLRNFSHTFWMLRVENEWAFRRNPTRSSCDSFTEWVCGLAFVKSFVGGSKPGDVEGHAAEVVNGVDSSSWTKQQDRF